MINLLFIAALVVSQLSGEPCVYDLNHDEECNVLDVQTAINALLSTPPGCTSVAVLFTICAAPYTKDGCVPSGVTRYEIIQFCGAAPTQ